MVHPPYISLRLLLLFARAAAFGAGDAHETRTEIGTRFAFRWVVKFVGVAFIVDIPFALGSPSYLLSNNKNGRRDGQGPFDIFFAFN